MDFVQPTTPTDSSGNELINKNNQQGNIVGDGTQQRVLTGFQKDGFGDGKDYGIKVSQEGFDVRTATDDQLVMSSGFNMFKIVDTGTASYSGGSIASGSKDTVTIPHSLSDTPAFLIYTTSPAIFGHGGGLVQTPLMYAVSGTSVINLYGRADTSNLYIDFLNVSASTQDLTGFTWNFKYYILVETAT